MFKTKVFNWNSRSTRGGMQYSLEKFSDEVNAFLERHQILGVERSGETQKIETWWACGFYQTVSYVIRYADE